MSITITRDLRSLSRDELSNWLSSHREPAYRLNQLWHALHARGITDWKGLTNLPLNLRQALADSFSMTPAVLQKILCASDGTTKLLLRYPDGATVECVRLLHDDHVTACLSTQVGCRMGCRFCRTAQIMFRRNLAAHEIEEQFHLLGKTLSEKPRNIVFMGMGEPLDNFVETVNAARLLGDPRGVDVGFRRITVSTAGIIPQIIQLADEEPRLKLALSLTSPFQKQRETLMPIACRYPLPELIEVIRYHIKRTGRRTTIEYILLSGINDTMEHAGEILRLTTNLSCKINLISFNPVAGLDFIAPTPEAAEQFLGWLRAGKNAVMLRQSLGAEVQAACGQLAGEF